MTKKQRDRAAKGPHHICGPYFLKMERDPNNKLLNAPSRETAIVIYDTHPSKETYLCIIKLTPEGRMQITINEEMLPANAAAQAIKHAVKDTMQ